MGLSIVGGGSDPPGNYGVVCLLVDRGKLYHVYPSVFFDLRVGVSVRVDKSNKSRQFSD